ncbi:uncharacterized protein LOC129915079 [Episyrphus balteatus]|uniref:uncharacterized protein LOC129915079 n=1 Tax=Episyrphus balteatus TaxID=286459 RepID=UPI00248606CF|nr:uncharacterized protein LOC129915079 [Episyrphus balteatus]
MLPLLTQSAAKANPKKKAKDSTYIVQFDFNIFGILIITFCINGYLHAGPVPSQLQGGSPYLPPLPESSSDYAKEVLKNTNTISYKTNHNSQNGSETTPQLKSESSYSRTYHNSYAAQPSGIGENLLLPPTSEPLPSLIPSTVLNQLKSTSSTTFPTLINNSIVSSTFSNNDENSLLPPSIVMVDSSMEVLTPSQNQTILAAKLLAESLLQKTEDSSSTKFDNLEPNEEKKFIPKDMYIVKAQKNAYIVPNNLNTMDMDIQELYSMRNNLDKAYINQFIFIVKPENINFLNKLV